MLFLCKATVISTITCIQNYGTSVALTLVTRNRIAYPYKGMVSQEVLLGFIALDVIHGQKGLLVQ